MRALKRTGLPGEPMNDIIDAISARIKAPYFGYALLAFVAMNWRGVFLLMTTSGSPQERLGAFDAETSFVTLIVLPLTAGAVVAALSPWVRLSFAFISSKPFEHIDNLHLDSEHKKTIRKIELERSRADLFAGKEAELIDRAKRDEEVLGIENAKLQEQLKSELETLRGERDRMSADLYSNAGMVSTSPTEKKMLKLAAESANGRISKNESLDGRSIQIGVTTFGSENPRDFSKYDSALKSLLSKNLVQDIGHRGEYFELTHTGWQIADAL